MAFVLDTIRATAERVAASHGLEVVDLEFSGGAKFRALRIFIEKDAAARATFAEEVRAARERGEAIAEVPAGIPLEALSGVTHTDCEAFASDFGTVLDVEDLIPGTMEYTLEVSSPGLERKLVRAADFERFQGFLVKVQTFTALSGNRHLQGRLVAVEQGRIRLDLSAVKPKGKARKKASALAEEGQQLLEVPLDNIEKAQLLLDF